MIGLESKLIISAKRLRNSTVAIVKDVFAIIGVMLTIAEAMSEIFGLDGLFIYYKEHFLYIMVIVLLICVWRNWDNLKYTVKIVGSDVSITLQVCDALKTRGALIIPTNTTFDTNTDDEFISAESLQGQYQLKYFKNRLGELNTKIAKGLESKNCISLTDGRKTNIKRYAIGTVCRISEKNRRAYFLADSDINAKGIAVNVEINDISKALISLWKALAAEGNQEPYVIPLLGTGKARAKDASRDEVVQEIISTFLVATKTKKITESLIICIHPNDYCKINWDGLCEFLKYKCQYADINP